MINQTELSRDTTLPARGDTIPLSTDETIALEEVRNSTLLRISKTPKPVIRAEDTVPYIPEDISVLLWTFGTIPIVSFVPVFVHSGFDPRSWLLMVGGVAVFCAVDFMSFGIGKIGNKLGLKQFRELDARKDLRLLAASKTLKERRLYYAEALGSIQQSFPNAQLVKSRKHGMGVALVEKEWDTITNQSQIAVVDLGGKRNEPILFIKKRKLSIAQGN